jgi:8-oxo-dGTP pyrophosphatase MutT (NUDIX family)
MDKPLGERPITTVSSRIAYQNPWLTIREDKTLRNGNQEGIYGVVETNDSVVVCAVNEHQEVYIVYGYSYPTDTWSWQIPGGGSDREPPLEAAKRELLEETGIEAKQFEQLGNLIVSCGLLTERMAVVLARELTMGERIEADDADTISKGKFVSLQEIQDMIASGDICDSQSVSAIYLTEKLLSK